MYIDYRQRQSRVNTEKDKGPVHCRNSADHKMLVGLIFFLPTSTENMHSLMNDFVTFMHRKRASGM